MHLELIKVTKDLRQDGYSQFMPPEVWKKKQSCVSYSGDLSGWIKHFKGQGVKAYLRYSENSKAGTCALYREVLPNDREDVVYLKNAVSEVLATELSSVEGYVYPRKG